MIGPKTISFFVVAIPLVFEHAKAQTPRALTSAGVTVRAVPNDNRVSAGRMNGGVLRVDLNAQPSIWYPEGSRGPAVPVSAFSAGAGAPRVPGPIIRVPAGTEIHATVRNSLGVRMTLRGLQDRQVAALDSFDIAAGATREIRFRANTPGTFYYWARTEGNREQLGRAGDSQLIGALIVDPPGVKANSRERIMIITLWEDTLRTIARPAYKETMVINGQSWPHTERFDHIVGDSVRWRVINASGAPHPMHLHGFYFSVLSRGDVTRDTIYSATQRRLAVTEFMRPMSTMQMQWVPTRPGNWLFHCHLIRHIDREMRLGEHGASAGHAVNHAEDGMAGLVMAIHVAPRKGEGFAADPVARRKLRLLVNTRPNVYGDKPGFSFVLQNGAEPARDSIVQPSSTIVLEKDQPTEITVVNRTSGMASIHWHGIELESYYDGVGDFSGWKKRTAPPIAPRDSFVVRMTPDRAGTFIYHTHTDETVQLSSGLYGSLIVLDKGARPDSTDRLMLLGSGGPAEDAPMFINGSARRDPVVLTSGVRHRFRFINISARGTQRIRLLNDSSFVQSWRPVSKDGADLPPLQVVSRNADVTMAPGETVDVEVLRPSRGTLYFEIITNSRRNNQVARVPVQVR